MNETAGEEISHSAPSAVSENGAIKDIDGKQCVYYDGYWIRHYEVPEDEDYDEEDEEDVEESIDG